MKKGDTVRIHLGDQAPRIGSGVRHVEILSMGHKWVTVKYRRAKGYPQYDVRQKFRPDTFNRLCANYATGVD